MAEACCICATLLQNISPPYSEKDEKTAAAQYKILDCCSRTICENCIEDNPRYLTYCPYCQTTTGPNPLPPNGLREPPTYPEPSSSNTHTTAPPPYTPLQSSPPINEKSNPTPPEDVLHFLNHKTDTLAGLSLLYSIPLPVLKRVNNITSDHLLQARRTVLIPGEFCPDGVSKSPVAIESEEEERRKGTVRRFMVTCKVHDYDVALLYLKQADYEYDVAVEAYRDDERWEKEHPLDAKDRGKRFAVGKRRFTGQRS